MYEHMKGIYEITHSFRKMEQESSIHQKEFLMLEYYYLATSTQQMQDITIDMLYQCVHYMEEKNKDLQLFTLKEIEHMQSLLKNIVSLSLEQAFSTYNNFNYSNFSKM